MDTSVIIDSLVVKSRAGVGVGETPTDVLSEWLAKLGLNDVDSSEDGGIVLVRFGRIAWDAGKYENKNCIRFSV